MPFHDNQIRMITMYNTYSKYILMVGVFSSLPSFLSKKMRSKYPNFDITVDNLNTTTREILFLISEYLEIMVLFGFLGFLFLQIWASIPVSYTHLTLPTTPYV